MRRLHFVCYGYVDACVINLVLQTSIIPVMGEQRAINYEFMFLAEKQTLVHCLLYRFVHSYHRVQLSH
jgi:hypothetical protein